MRRRRSSSGPPSRPRSTDRRAWRTSCGAARSPSSSGCSRPRSAPARRTRRRMASRYLCILAAGKLLLYLGFRTVCVTFAQICLTLSVDKQYLGKKYILCVCLDIFPCILRYATSSCHVAGSKAGFRLTVSGRVVARRNDIEFIHLVRHS